MGGMDVITQEKERDAIVVKMSHDLETVYRTAWLQFNDHTNTPKIGITSIEKDFLTNVTQQWEPQLTQNGSPVDPVNIDAGFGKGSRIGHKLGWNLWVGSIVIPYLLLCAVFWNWYTNWNYQHIVKTGFYPGRTP